jgi:hypothetical protein
MTYLLLKPHAARKRRSSPSLAIDANWQPLSLVVRRLMKRHGLPRPTAIITAEAAGLNVGVVDR